MDIMELGAIGELVGGVAVIATILYLAIQVRQNAMETRAASSQALTDSYNQVNLVIAANPARAALTRRAMADYLSLPDDEKACFDFEAYSFCHVWETILHRERLGVADAETTKIARDTIKAIFGTSSGYRQWWARNQFPFTTEFTAFVDECLTETGRA